MIKIFLTLFSAALAPATPGQMDQFNLKCIGTSQTYTGAKDGSSPTPKIPWLQTYRVDIVGQAYCEDDCSTVNRISKLTADELLLDGIGGRTAINRNTGRLMLSRDLISTNTNVSPPRQTFGGLVMIQAICEPGPFSGFPIKPRKF
jgi:hypothetical protein